MISPFYKQLFVSAASLLAALSVGGAVSYPTVLLHQLKANNTAISLDFDTASWIGSIHGLAGIPSIIMPNLMQRQGRKFAFIAACFIVLSGWILSYFAESATFLLISESFHGFGSNSIYAVTCLSTTEMMAPQYRDIFIQMYYISLFLSMAVNGLLTQYVHWKSISLIMMIPISLALVIAFLWPESPYWLAHKQKFRECEKAFTWLRGTDMEAQKELNQLINAQKCSRKQFKSYTVQFFWEKITSRDFYVPLAHIFILEFLVQGIGCIITVIYAIELFGKATNNTEVAMYGGFIVNTIQFLGLFVNIILNKYFKNKTMLLTSIAGAILSLLSGACVSYLQDTGALSKDTLWCVYCLIVYMVSISLGIIPIPYPMASALMPVKHRGLGGMLYVCNTCIFHTLALKLAPYLFLYAHLYGSFLIFALNGSICGLIIWKYVPETKNRTLQDIEEYYNNGEFKNINEEGNNLEHLMQNERTDCIINS